MCAHEKNNIKEIVDSVVSIFGIFQLLLILDTYDRYRAQRVAVKLAVEAAKRMADRRWGERLGNDFEGNKKMF